MTQLFNYTVLKYCFKKFVKNNIFVSDETLAMEYCGVLWF